MRSFSGTSFRLLLFQVLSLRLLPIRLLHVVAIAALLLRIVVDIAVPSDARAEGPNAILDLPGCTSMSLARGDDAVSQQASLGFTINFFGASYSSLFVNNNGNVTFDAALSAYRPFNLTSTTTPIIAAYFDDVDTRNTATQPVRYGTTQFGGRNAFCVNWVNVGQYPQLADQLNSFQLLLVDRSDTGAGNFDLYLNYDKIQFNQRGAGVGYAKGNPSDPNTFFQFAGSLQAGSFLDSNLQNGLIHGNRGSTQLGRYLFEVRGGAVPVGGRIVGRVTDGSNPLVGATVQACPNQAGLPCVITKTNSSGDFGIGGLPVFAPGYGLYVHPPAGVSLVTNALGPLQVIANQDLRQDVVLLPFRPTPSGTSVTGSGVIDNTGGVPTVLRGRPFTITTTGQANCRVTYKIILNGAVIATGPMTEAPPGTYTATVTLPAGIHGYGQIEFDWVCPDRTFTSSGGSIWIDPSGFVKTVQGAPVVGATVTLYRSDSSAGPFTQVPNGSDIMSPGNRQNPDTTDTIGHFGWDVIAGYYKVRAEKPGCTAPGNPGQTFVETAVLTEIRHPFFDLDLRLDCGSSAPEPPSVTCIPRPPVVISTVRAGTGRLQVTVRAGGGQLRQLRFNTDAVHVPNPNARVEVTEGTINGSVVTLPANRTETVFFVRRQAAGASTVPFIIVDDCGEWPTFVGGGANGF